MTLVLSSLLAALVLTVEPARLPQQTPVATARIHVSDGKSGSARRLRGWCSLGSLSVLVETGGNWEATWSAPPAGRPQWAVIAVWDDATGEAAAAAVALEGRSEFPADTEPGAQVVVQVGGHHATARADSLGKARVTTLVAPEARSARISAVDAAGNTTLEEVKLDAPPGGVWLLAPPEAVEGADTRVMAFASGGARIRLRVARGKGELQLVEEAPGVLVALLRAHGALAIAASADAARAEVEVRYRPAPRPAAPPLPPKLVEPRWEVGATVGARFSGDFVGANLSVEYRHQLRGGRWHAGVDLFGLYADGNAASNDVTLGGVGARAVIELRLPVGPLAALLVDGAVGGAYLREHRTPTVTSPRTLSDGAPTLSLGVGLLAKAGRGLFVLRLGFVWTPLMALGLANLDGGALSVGYHYGRW